MEKLRNLPRTTQAELRWKPKQCGSWVQAPNHWAILPSWSPGHPCLGISTQDRPGVEHQLPDEWG